MLNIRINYHLPTRPYQITTTITIMSQPLSNYLPGFASLLEQIDKRVLVLLRDGRSLFGILRSIDQFANLVLHLTVERIYIGDEYGEIDRGVFLIRGENVVLCGELVSNLRQNTAAISTLRDNYER